MQITFIPNFRHALSNMERCMSCISKLGAPSMSRSSTATGSGTPGAGQPLNWTVLSNEYNYQSLHQNGCTPNPYNFSSLKLNTSGLDRMSVCSSHGSFGSSSSEYSVPRMSCAQQIPQDHESWYEKIPSPQQPQKPKQEHCHIQRASSPLSQYKNCPPIRPPKFKGSKVKPPMPLPLHSSTITHQPCQQQFVRSYENYDIPKAPAQIPLVNAKAVNSAMENYDTPKKIQEYLTNDMNCNAAVNIYGNYDMPTVVSGSGTSNMCGCLTGNITSFESIKSVQGVSSGPRADCTCTKVMSWADTWITLPYCRRGNGIENTGVPIKVKLSGEGKMPVVQPSGELAIYATVDMTKKIKKKLLEHIKDCECDHEKDNDDGSITQSSLEASNYINLAPERVLPVKLIRAAIEETAKEAVEDPESARNYMNLDFALSLENYENAKEVLQKVGFNIGELEETLKECIPNRKICQKCGHVSKQKTPNEDASTQKVKSTYCNEVAPTNDSIDYLLMEPGRNNFPGYLPMSPATPNGTATLGQALTITSKAKQPKQSKQPDQPNDVTELPPNDKLILEPQSAQQQKKPHPPPLTAKNELMKRILGQKSASNPSLGPAIDRTRKRVDQEARVPGSAMMALHKTGSSPYSRKLIMDSSDLLPVNVRLTAHKRSSSADSTVFLQEKRIGNKLICSEILPKAKYLCRGRRASSPCLHPEKEHSPNLSLLSNFKSESPDCNARSNTEVEDDTSISINLSQSVSHQSVYIRRSASVPCKAQNRDSSSSNDSGVSTGSVRYRTNEYTDFELPLTTANSSNRHQRHTLISHNTVHSSLPRRSKSFDPLREITFQFQRNGKFGEKSTSAEAEIPICLPKANINTKIDFNITNDGGSVNGTTQPYIDSRSTSSGTSDLSDYIETLSLSSHSSSDTPEGLR